MGLLILTMKVHKQDIRKPHLDYAASLLFFNISYDNIKIYYLSNFFNPIK